MKKSVVVSIAVCVVLTLTLALSTIFSGIGKTAEKIAEYYFAYRTGDVCEELSGFSGIDFGFDVNDSSSMIVRNNGALEANNQGSVVVSAKKGKTNCSITIEVFEQGSGVAGSPWVIANAKHLNELSGLVGSGDANACGDNFVCELKTNIDLAGKNFVPIGNRNNSFKGTFEGNNKTISNLTIDVNANNYEDFLVKANYRGMTDGFFDLGMFGYTNGAAIKNVNLKAASVSIADNVVAAVNNEVAASSALGIGKLRRVSIGALVANATQTTIEGADNLIEASVNGYSYAAAPIEGENEIDTAISAVVGVGYGIDVSGYKVNARINAMSKTNVGSLVGSVVGLALNDSAIRSSISDLNVTLMGNVANVAGEKSLRLGGLVGNAYGTDISNSTVSGVAIADNVAFSGVNTISTNNCFVAGAVCTLGSDATITNVKVKNSAINVKGGVSGLVDNNYGQVINCAVEGSLTGVEVGGLVRANHSGAQVEFDENFSGKAVNATLSGLRVGGVVCENEGTVSGDSSSNKTEVNVVLKNVASVFEQSESIRAIRELYLAGLAVSNSANGNIACFNLNVKMYDGINMAGLVGIMGRKFDQISTEPSTASVLENNDADVTIMSNSLAPNNTSTTYSIAGGVGFAYGDCLVNSNNIVLSVNANRVGGRNYGVAQMGGVVARIFENGARINGNTVSGNMYVNYSGYITTITDPLGNNPTDHKLMLVGGLVGSISGFGNTVKDGVPVDTHTALTLTNATEFENNTLENLVINIDYNNENGLGEYGHTARALGSVIGCVVGDGSSSINLSATTINNLEIIAYEATFAASNGTVFISLNNAAVGSLVGSSVLQPTSVTGFTRELK